MILAGFNRGGKGAEDKKHSRSAEKKNCHFVLRYRQKTNGVWSLHTKKLKLVCL